MKTFHLGLWEILKHLFTIFSSFVDNQLIKNNNNNDNDDDNDYDNKNKLMDNQITISCSPAVQFGRINIYSALGIRTTNPKINEENKRYYKLECSSVPDHHGRPLSTTHGSKENI